MNKKVSIITLTLAIFLNSMVSFSAPRKNSKGRQKNNKRSASTKSTTYDLSGNEVSAEEIAKTNAEVGETTQTGKIVNFGNVKVGCPLANKVWNKTIFKDGQSVNSIGATSISLDVKTNKPLNEMIDKEILKDYNNKFKSDIYVEITQMNEYGAGFIKCSSNKYDKFDSIVALNADNLDEYCFRTGETVEDLLTNNPYKSGQIKVISGDSVLCSDANTNPVPLIAWNTDNLTQKVGADTETEEILKVSNSCIGIADELEEIKNLATGTAVASGIGTASAGGALGVGIVKANNDKKIEGKSEKVELKSEEEIISDFKSAQNQAKDLINYGQSMLDSIKDVEHISFHDSGYFNQCDSFIKKGDNLYGQLVLAIPSGAVINSLTDDAVQLCSQANNSETKMEFEGAINKMLEALELFVNTSEEEFKQGLSINLEKVQNKYMKDSAIDDYHNAGEYSSDKDIKKSKTLGNIRTGLLAGATATSGVSTATSFIADAKAKKIKEKVEACNVAVANLKITETSSEKAKNVKNACQKFDTENLQKVIASLTASGITSAVGTATALGGTITSFIANTDKTMNGDANKAKGLNIASTVLAGVTTGTSTASTTLSLTVINKLKNDLEMAKNCEAVLNQ